MFYQIFFNSILAENKNIFKKILQESVFLKIQKYSIVSFYKLQYTIETTAIAEFLTLPIIHFVFIILILTFYKK